MSIMDVFPNDRAIRKAPTREVPMRHHYAKVAVKASVLWLLLGTSSFCHAENTLINKDEYIHASYEAGRQRIYYFAVEFTGDFNRINAMRALDFGKSHAKKTRTTLDLSKHQYFGRHRIDWITSKNRHILVGYYNEDSNETGWIAGTNEGCCAYWFMHDQNNSMGRADDVHDQLWETNGYHITGSIFDDDRFNIVICISDPK